MLFCIILIILSSIAYSQYYHDYESSDTGSSYYDDYSGEGALVIGWYDVSQEEIEFCKDYGGSLEGYDIYGGSGAGYTQPVSNLTLTLQGQYTTLYDKTLYEIAWYVHPLSEDTSYKVYAVTEDNDNEEIHAGYATALDGEAGYESLETDTVYNTLKIVMEDGTTALSVPFVEKTQY